MTEKEIISTLKEICADIEKASESSTFFDITCRISHLFRNTQSPEVQKFFKNRNGVNMLVVSVPWALLSNEVFLSSISNVLQSETIEVKRFRDKQLQERTSYRDSEKMEPDTYKEILKRQRIESSAFDEQMRNKNESEKQLIQIALYLSCLPLSISRVFLNSETVNLFSRQYNLQISMILGRLNHEFSRVTLTSFLNQIVYDAKYHIKKDFSQDFKPQLDSKLFFDNLSASRSIAGVVLILSSVNERFARTLNGASYSLSKNQKYKLSHAVRAIARQIRVIEKWLDKYVYECNQKFKNPFLEDLIKDIVRDTDLNTLFILKTMVNPLKRDPQKPEFEQAEKINEMIENSSIIKSAVESHFESHFSVFNNTTTKDNDWSNKLFLISLKTLSVFEQISKTRDGKWKISVFYNEFTTWIEEINKVINKYRLEDDWDVLKKYLSSENTQVEWKSSFYTSTQDQFVSHQNDRELSKKILLSVVKPILGMLNTDGGTILVGVVENPEKIVRKNVLNNILERDNYHFFDIDYEFKSKKTDFDRTKRQIQDCLYLLTSHTAERFNGLINYESFTIKSAGKTATIVKISVEKSEEYFYCKTGGKGEQNPIYSLIKRADGRTIEVDLRDFLSTKNNA